MKNSFFMVVLAFTLPWSALSLGWHHPLKKGKAVVDIDGQIKTLTPGTSCKPQNWGWESDPQLSSCKCCLIKESLRGSNLFKIAGNQIPFCLKKKQCTLDTFSQLRQEANRNGTRHLVEDVINSCQVVKDVHHLEKEHLSDLKNLSPEGVLKALESLKLISNRRCYTVQNFGEAGGANTLQLFGVFSSPQCNTNSAPAKLKYIVKGLAHAHQEVERLSLIRKSFLEQYNLENPHRPYNFPALAMNVKNFRYLDSQQRAQYIAILIAAPGQPLFKWIKKYDSSLLVNFSLTPEAFELLGQQLGTLHSTYMIESKGVLTGYSRAVHGDLHTNNIFYDETTHQITLIDIETMALSLQNPQHVALDLRRLYIYPTLHFSKQHRAAHHIGKKEWHDTFIKPFLRAYIQAYLHQRGNRKLGQVMTILRNTYLSPLRTPVDLSSIFIRAGLPSYYRAQKLYLRPLLDSLEKEFQDREKKLSSPLPDSSTFPHTRTDLKEFDPLASEA